MQMGILRFWIVGIEIRQAHISNLTPLSRTGFDITVILGIERMFFYTLIEFDGIVKCLTIACGTGIFRQSVDSKTDSIELLLGIQRLTFIVHTPIDATILLVNKMLYQIVLGPCCGLQILGITQNTIRCRERPQDTGIKDSPFLCLRMKHPLTIDTTIKTTVFMILHLVKPETQDVFFQNILHFLLQHFDIHIPFYSISRYFLNSSLMACTRFVVSG